MPKSIPKTKAFSVFRLFRKGLRRRDGADGSMAAAGASLG